MRMTMTLAIVKESKGRELFLEKRKLLLNEGKSKVIVFKEGEGRSKKTS